jgi:NitT/TauT family transport system substrate-binding protein
MVGQVDFFSGWVINQTYQIELEAAKPDAPPTLKGKVWHALRLAEWGIPTYSAVLFTTGATVRDNPDLVRRYLRAVARGMRFVLDHPEDAVSVVAQAPGQMEDAKKLAWRWHLQNPLFVSADTRAHGPLWMNPSVWDEMAQFLRDGEQIQRAVPAAEVMTDGFLPGTAAQ